MRQAISIATINHGGRQRFAAGWGPADRPSRAGAPLLIARMAADDTHGPAPADPPPASMPAYRPRPHGRAAAIGLRLGGLALIGLAIVALALLFRAGPAGSRHMTMPVEYLLALIGFAGASCGSILLVLGVHIFDAVEISERWQPRK